MSEKKASEGMALLSMYGDDDDEMEDLNEEKEKWQEEDTPLAMSDLVDTKFVNDNYSNETMPVQQGGQSSSANSTQPSIFSPQQQQQQTPQVDLTGTYVRKSRLTIVDYGHEEGVMSPEAEAGEAIVTGQVMNAEMLQKIDGELGQTKSPGVSQLPTPITHATPQSLDHPGVDVIERLEFGEIADAIMVPVEQKDMNPLDKFLPLPPNAKCSDQLQEKIIKFLALKKTAGRSFNTEVRNRKEYRNPDFLLHAVTYQGIDQIGSCFSKDVFNPHGYYKCDFYDALEADMKREAERREQERKRSQKIEFASGGLQSTNVVPTPKPNIPTTGLINISSVTPSINVTSRDGRQNKKSKWDKV